MKLLSIITTSAIAIAVWAFAFYGVYAYLYWK